MDQARICEKNRRIPLRYTFLQYFGCIRLSAVFVRKIVVKWFVLGRSPSMDDDRRRTLIDFRRISPMRSWLTALILALAMSAPSPVSAQIATGNIYGTVVDQQGGLMPGANISLVAAAIGGQPRTTTTDASGQFRFLNLDNATYTVTVELAGFQKQSRDIIV